MVVKGHMMLNLIIERLKNLDERKLKLVYNFLLTLNPEGR